MNKYITEVVAEQLVNNTVRELKNLGIKAPKTKKHENRQLQQGRNVFGVPIKTLPHKIIDEHKGITVPSFLIDILARMDEEPEAQCLFKFRGHPAIQRQIRTIIENQLVFNWKRVSVYDLASVIKQYLRKLPKPLISKKFHGALLKAQKAEQRAKCTLLLCLLLPLENVNFIRYFMLYLKRLLAFSYWNSLDVHSLAFFLTADLFHLDKRSEKFEDCMEIVVTLITHAEEIGVVPCQVVANCLEPKTSCIRKLFQRRKKRKVLLASYLKAETVDGIGSSVGVTHESVEIRTPVELDLEIDTDFVGAWLDKLLVWETDSEVLEIEGNFEEVEGGDVCVLTQSDVEVAVVRRPGLAEILSDKLGKHPSLTKLYHAGIVTQKVAQFNRDSHNCAFKPKDKC